MAAFVPIEEVPSLAYRYSVAEAARRAAYEAPWTEAILRVLEWSQYKALERHDDRWIADSLGISTAEARDSIAYLRRAGIVRRRSGSYYVRDVASVDTRGDKERINALLTHWTEVAARRIASRGSDDFFAYNVCGLSRTDHARVVEVLRGAFREIRSIVAASSPTERVALLNLQLVSFQNYSSSISG